MNADLKLMGHVSAVSEISLVRLSTHSENVLFLDPHLQLQIRPNKHAKPISDYIKKESFQHGGATSAVAPAARLDESGRL